MNKFSYQSLIVGMYLLSKHDLKLAHTYDSAASMPTNTYQYQIVSTVFKKLKPRNPDMDYWSILSEHFLTQSPLPYIVIECFLLLLGN